ncbi:unnamed protein product, partial [Ectocarpus sp. 4 AP-2014]
TQFTGLQRQTTRIPERYGCKRRSPPIARDSRHLHHNRHPKSWPVAKFDQLPRGVRCEGIVDLPHTHVIYCLFQTTRRNTQRNKQHRQ